ncbi:hypothetical protein BH23ACT11_BH23ACT11_19850 [soil metagenome]
MIWRQNGRRPKAEIHALYMVYKEPGIRIHAQGLIQDEILFGLGEEPKMGTSIAMMLNGLRLVRKSAK